MKNTNKCKKTKNTRAFSILLVIIMLFTTLPFTVSASEVTTTTPVGAPLTVKATSNFFPEISAEYNEDTKEVTVIYRLGLSKDMLNVECYLTYDETILSFDKNKNMNSSGNGLGIMPQVDTGVFYNTEIPGEINFCASNISLYPIKDDQPFVTVTFDVIGEGETVIDLEVSVLSVADLDEYAMVDQDSIEYYVSYGNVNEIEGIPNPTKKTELTESTYTVPTDPKPTILGDVDGDGLVTIKDATTVQEHIAKYTSLTGQAAINADVNGSGDINIRDATEIQMYTTKYIVEFK